MNVGFVYRMSINKLKDYLLLDLQARKLFPELADLLGNSDDVIRGTQS